MKSRVARGAIGSFALKIGSAGLSFIAGVLLARLLGASGYGTYAYATAWVSLLSVPSVMGLDKLLVREIAVYKKKQRWSDIRRLLSWANLIAFGTSAFVVCIAAAAAWLIAGGSPDIRVVTFLIALSLIPLVALTRIRQAALKGLHRVVAGQIPEMLVQPVVLIACLAAAFLLMKQGLSAPQALWINVTATAVAFLFGAFLLYRALPDRVKTAAPGVHRPEWLRSALPLMLLAALQILNGKLDILMLGSMLGTRETGIYSVANRGASLVTYVLVAVNTALSPAIASLHAAGDPQRLQRMITKSSRAVLIISLPVCLGLIIFGDFFLAIFGHAFQTGRTSLGILSAGQLFSAAMGSVTLLLVMTGHERDAVLILAGSTLLNFLLNLVLIPRWGIEGAAVANTASVVMRNGAAALFAYRRIGIHSTALGPPGR